MMAKIWAFCARPANLALIVALGGGAAWLWGQIKPAAPPQNESVAAPEPAPLTENVTADNGSTAVNARDNSTVTITK